MRSPRIVSTLAIALVLTCAPAPSVSAAPATKTHVVQAGETLWGLSRTYGVSVTAIAAANKLTVETKVRIGQRLNVPSVLAATPSVTARFPGDLRYKAALDLIPIFKAAATEAGIGSDLLMSVAYTESSWRQWVVSRDGAVGLGQLMPMTAVWLASDIMGEPSLRSTNTRDNLRMSARYLRWLHDRFNGNSSLALAAYFEGPAQVQRVGVSPAGARYAKLTISRRSLFVKI